MKEDKRCGEMKAANAVVRVGICVLVQDPLSTNKIFAGIRGSACGHGKNLLALPGGHLEMFESFEDCAMREVSEEMGLQLDPDSITQLHVSNDMFPDENKHYVTIALIARLSPDCIKENRRPENLEPQKCLGWESYSWEELSAISKGHGGFTLFPSLAALVEARPAAVIKFLGSMSTF